MLNMICEKYPLALESQACTLIRSLNALEDVEDYLEQHHIPKDKKVAVVGHNAFFRIHLAKDFLLGSDEHNAEAFIPNEIAVNLTNAEIFPHPDFKSKI